MNVYDAWITDFDYGDIECELEDGTIYTVEDCFRFVVTTPHMGILYLKDKRGNNVLDFNMEHGDSGFENRLVMKVAQFVEDNW